MINLEAIKKAWNPTNDIRDISIPLYVDADNALDMAIEDINKLADLLQTLHGQIQCIHAAFMMGKSDIQAGYLNGLFEIVESELGWPYLNGGKDAVSKD